MLEEFWATDQESPSVLHGQQRHFTLYRKGVMSIQVIDACTYALLARKMQPAPPGQSLAHHTSQGYDSLAAQLLSTKA